MSRYAECASTRMRHGISTPRTSVEVRSSWQTAMQSHEALATLLRTDIRPHASKQRVNAF